MAAYSRRDMVEDYLRYKLLSQGLEWRSRPTAFTPSSAWRPEQARTSRGGAPTDHAHIEAWVAPPPVQVALRFAGDTLARRHGNSLVAQALLLLQCGDRSSAGRRRNLSRVREELFRDGVNWGRIVAMMELGGALSVEVARVGRLGQVDDIATWLEESLDTLQLQGWIEDNGGWDAFVELYGDSRPQGSFWTVRMMFGLAILGVAGITLGALFSQK
ncbi:apoptosis regulator Bcl-2-like [Betta splendens]|uniref:Apoptosis regulator Bcl-2-like n=1 Tax=Betta splendens TaxID=158456 RepID=A0A8M1HDT5_BETSP|nr:apoptosis regulator Bcl-2-like [Betta splendens]XP_055363687.1 apoptosis regulator Bcl-2-like [Betta splendens]